MRSTLFLTFTCFSILCIFHCSGESKSSLFTFHNQPNRTVTPPDSGKFVLVSITTPVELYNFSYDDAGRMTKEVIGQAFTSGIINNYDTSGNISFQTYYEWSEDDADWKFAWKTSNIYDNHGNLLSSTQESNAVTRTFAVRFPARGYYDTTGQKLEHKTKDIIVYSARKVLYTYDSSGNLLIRLTKKWGSQDYPSGNEYYTYDNNGNRLTNTNKYLDEDNWSDLEKVSFTYDKNGKQLSESREFWENNRWVKTGRDSDTYDKNGNLLIRIQESWENNRWASWGKKSCTYDLKGNLLTELAEKWKNNRWVNEGRESKTYDSNGNLLTHLKEVWENNRWVNSTKTSNIYDNNGNLLTTSQQEWKEKKWNDFSASFFTFDQHGNTISGDVYPEFPNNWMIESIQLTYNFRRDHYKLIIPDKFEAKYKFIPTKKY